MARFQLQPLLEHARHRLEAAERLLRMLRRRKDAASQRLQELTQYREDYRQRYAGSGAKGMDIHLLRDYQLFMLKLEAAVRHQAGELAQHEASWQAGYQKWLAQRQRVRAYETLESRHRVEESRRLDKIEQRQSDEANTQRHARNAVKSIH